MALFDKENIPKTTSWIKNLGATEAIQQCQEWSIPPADTLEENRVNLRNFVKSHQGTPEDDGSKESNQNNMEDMHTATHTDTHKTEHNVQPQTTPPPLDPNIKFLVDSMQQLTMNAMTETARMIAKEMQSSPSSRTPDETTIPPYVRDMIKNISPLTTNDQDQIFTFLKKVHKLIKLNLTSERAILLNLGALIQNSLHEFWMDKVANHTTGEQLINGILQTALTPDKLRQLQNQYLYRPQNTHEGLADYVRDIQCNFKILSPKTPESEIFNVVFRGVNSQTRTTFAGLPPVTSIQDLINIAPLSASLAAPPVSHQSNDSTYRNRFQPAFPKRYYTPPNQSNQPQHTYSNFSPNYNRQQSRYHTNLGQNFFPNHNNQRQFTQSFTPNWAYQNRGQTYNNSGYQGPSHANAHHSNQNRFPQSNSRRGAR